MAFFTMMQACRETGLAYETLKFYCNEGLVPNVKRDANNRRIFDGHDIAWIKDLVCLKRCGMGIGEMKDYLALCLEGEKTIPKRKDVLDEKKRALVSQLEEIQKSIDYIEYKQSFYNDVLAGKIEYRSNLISH